MPPDRYLSQDAFDMDMLDPQALDTPDGLATALRTIEAACHRGDHEIAEVVEALNSRSYILEYIISGRLRVPVVTSTDNLAFQCWRRGRTRSFQSGSL